MRQVMTFAAAAAVAMTAGVAAGQEARTVEQYTCKEVMRASGEERDLAIVFLHGYLLGKSGRGSFRPDDLAAATDRFIDHCLDHPKESAVEALRKVAG